MALPTDDEVTAYLRLDTSVEAELITGINNSAKAHVSRYLGCPLDQRTQTFLGRRPRRGPRREAREQLTIPVQPCATSATITDVDGVTVDDTTYVIDPITGQINIEQDAAFDNGPYTIEATVGMSAHPYYVDDIEPILRQVLLHICSDYYNRRNAGAIYEQSGGQVSITYTEDAIPPVIRTQLEQLRPKARAW